MEGGGGGRSGADAQDAEDVALGRTLFCLGRSSMITSSSCVLAVLALLHVRECVRGGVASSVEKRFLLVVSAVEADLEALGAATGMVADGAGFE